MIPQNLYIIGNGFDMYHGLDTSYQSFAFFMKKNYSEIYGLLIKYYDLPDLNPDDAKSYKDPHWGDFEKALAGLDFETVLDDGSNYVSDPSSPDFTDGDWGSYQIEMERIVNNLTIDLCKSFKEFILSVQFPDSVDNKLLLLENNSVFLNFNYTDTLEKYYFVNRSRILYIHGKAKNSNEKIILGHGVHPSTFKEKEKEPPDGLNEEQLEMWREQMSDNYSYSYELGKDELMSYFNASYKSTDEIIKEHTLFFNILKDVKKIFVLGHSISEVDQPYFQKVIQSVDDKKATWIVSYFSDEAYNSHLKKLFAFGLEKEQIRLIKMEALKPTRLTLF
jgi:hypothetical protein